MGSIEDGGEGGEYGIVIVGFVAKLGYGLCDEDVEPIQRFGLVGVDIVVGFGEDRCWCEAGRGPENMGCGTLAVELLWAEG